MVKLCKDRFFLLMSFAALLASFILYYITKAPSVSFWDCGEFIASTYILGVPHPPGYPFYIVIGRLFTLLPIAGSVALRVNLLSVLGGAASVFVAFWLIIRIIVGRGEIPRGLARIGLGIGAFSGAVVMGLSRTFWSNAVETEVYTLAMLLMLLISYVVLLWAQSDPEKRPDNLLILISYLSWLSLGIHMTTFIIVIPAVFYMAYIDFTETGLKRWPVWLIMLLFVLYAVPLQTEILWLFGIDISKYELESFIILFALALAAVTAVMLITRLRKSEAYKAWSLAFLLMISAAVGYSTQAYIPIRAALRPAINENAPSDWSRFKGFLERKQYGQESMIRRMFKRRGSWINQMISSPRFGLLRIFNTEYASPDARITFSKGGEPKSGGAPDNFGISLAMIYIIIFGLYGVFESIRRAPPDGLFIVGLTILCTVGLAVYMNFSDGAYNTSIAPQAEVRDRDYFYTPGFMYYGILIGVGLAALLYHIGRSANVAGRKNFMIPLFIMTCLGSAALAAQTAATNFGHNNRRGNYLPSEYAKNILNSCDRDAILFTNGDNDTFPLWYMQQVEKYRTDVRVANLSLLNTDWYIRQLRDQMNVPIRLSDAEIDSLRPFRLQNSNMIYRIQDQMVQEILAQDQSMGWKIPVYFAATVPSENKLGLDDNLIMEGMAYRVVESTGKDRVNTQVGFRIFGNRDNFKSALDRSVRKDDNDQRLILNYVVAMFQISDDYYNRGSLDSALTMARMASDIQPDMRLWQIDAFVARILAAQGKFDEVAAMADRSPEGENIYLAASQDLLKNSQFDKAETLLKMALARYPSSLTALNNLAAIYWQEGDTASFDALIYRFRTDNAGDPQMLDTVDQLMEKLKKLPVTPPRKP